MTHLQHVKELVAQNCISTNSVCIWLWFAGTIWEKNFSVSTDHHPARFEASIVLGIEVPEDSLVPDDDIVHDDDGSGGDDCDDYIGDEDYGHGDGDIFVVQDGGDGDFF